MLAGLFRSQNFITFLDLQLIQRAALLQKAMLMRLALRLVKQAITMISIESSKALMKNRLQVRARTLAQDSQSDSFTPCWGTGSLHTNQAAGLFFITIAFPLLHLRQ